MKKQEDAITGSVRQTPRQKLGKYKTHMLQRTKECTGMALFSQKRVKSASVSLLR